jgi:hypothetical protein
MARPVPKHALDPDTGEIDLDAVSDWYAHLHANDLYQSAFKAMRACEEFVNSVEAGAIDLNYMALATADPLVLEVERFVASYEARFGRRLR